MEAPELKQVDKEPLKVRFVKLQEAPKPLLPKPKPPEPKQEPPKPKEVKIVENRCHRHLKSRKIEQVKKQKHLNLLLHRQLKPNLHQVQWFLRS